MVYNTVTELQLCFTDLQRLKMVLLVLLCIGLEEKLLFDFLLVKVMYTQNDGIDIVWCKFLIHKFLATHQNFP